jgi:hypothetical protein
MKKVVFCLILGGSLFMTSCFTYTYTVGEGPQSGVVVTEKNHYVVYGLAPIKTSDPIEMAGTAEDYEVTIQHTFVDGLINALTLGIYNPTTTMVKK